MTVGNCIYNKLKKYKYSYFNFLEIKKYFFEIKII